MEERKNMHPMTSKILTSTLMIQGVFGEERLVVAQLKQFSGMKAEDDSRLSLVTLTPDQMIVARMEFGVLLSLQMRIWPYFSSFSFFPHLLVWASRTR